VVAIRSPCIGKCWWTDIFTSPFSWNKWPSKCCFCDPNYRVKSRSSQWNDSNNSLFKACCVLCWRMIPHNKSFVWSLKQHLGGHWFHNNKEVTMAGHEWLWMQQPDSYHYRNVDVLLTVHLSIILVTDQLNAQILVL
jgi:hypothetical protein